MSDGGNLDDDHVFNRDVVVGQSLESGEVLIKEAIEHGDGLAGRSEVMKMVEPLRTIFAVPRSR